MTRRANANLRGASDALASELDDLIESASELLENLKDQRGEAVDNLRTRASRSIDNARRRLAAVKPQAQEAAAEAVRVAAGFVRRNPWRAVAIGALLFAAVGMFLHAGDDD